MPFLGKQPTAGFASIVKDDLTADGSTTAFTLSKNVASANDIAVFVGNVRQEPTDAYTVSGTTLTMSAAPASGINFYVLHIAGTVESSVVPADNTISSAKLQSDLSLTGDITITSSTQYEGLAVHNGSNNVVEVAGFGSGNDAGGVKLYNSGSPVTEIQSVADSYFLNSDVGIGVSSPETKLHIKGGDNATSVLTIDATATGGGRKWSFRPGDPITPSNGYFTLRDETAGENRVVITDSGQFRVGHSLATTTITTTGSGNLFRTYSSTNGSGFHFTGNAIYPANYNGSFVDNQIQWGSGAYRWHTIFAASGSINTSDENEKQDIENLSDAERTVATAIKGLIKKYRFIDAVEERGDNARIHVGVIAQEVEQAFVDAGLDPRRYGMFCEDIWYEVDGEANPDEPYTEDTPGAVRKVRLGIRYDELLAFVISAM